MKSLKICDKEELEKLNLLRIYQKFVKCIYSQMSKAITTCNLKLEADIQGDMIIEYLEKREKYRLFANIFR